MERSSSLRDLFGNCYMVYIAVDFLQDESGYTMVVSEIILARSTSTRRGSLLSGSKSVHFQRRKFAASVRSFEH